MLIVVALAIPLTVYFVGQLQDIRQNAASINALPKGTQRVMISGKEFLTHGKDDESILTAIGERPARRTVSRSAPCIGNGTDGPRVHVLYTYDKSKPSRYVERLPLIRAITAGMSDMVSTASEESGGQREIRFLTTPDCQVAVTEVGLSGHEFNFGQMIDELRSLGFSGMKRKFVIFSEFDWGCGFGSAYTDDKKGWDNQANLSDGYGFTGNFCFEYLGNPVVDIPVHELMHTLGAVQPSSPNKGPDGGFHCTDANDLMCYDDSENNHTHVVCPVWEVDCSDDDYFNLNPPANSYLATHWNTAYSVFLDDPTRNAQVTPSAGSVPAGNAINISLSGFQPSELVMLRFNDSQNLSEQSVDANGSWNGNIAIPGNTAPGSSALVARGSKGSYAESTITINPNANEDKKKKKKKKKKKNNNNNNNNNNKNNKKN